MESMQKMVTLLQEFLYRPEQRIIHKQVGPGQDEILTNVSRFHHLGFETGMENP